MQRLGQAKPVQSPAHIKQQNDMATSRRSDRVYPTFTVAVLWLVFAVPVHAETTLAKPAYITFGFLPIVSPERLVKRFAPLTDYLSRKTGVEVRMETAPDFQTFVQRTQREQRYDILFTAPHLYYLAHRERGYRALVRVDRPGMQAVIVAPRDRGIGTVEDLRNHRLATTDPLALATVLVRARLEAGGIDPDRDLRLIPTPSHNASLLSTYRGATDAAALILPLFLRASPEIRESMRIITKTRMVPHMPIAVAPWVDTAMAKRIGRILTTLDESPQGRALLTHLAWPGFVPASEEEYARLGWIARAVKVD